MYPYPDRDIPHGSHAPPIAGSVSPLTRIARLARKAWSTPSLRVTAFFAAAGVGFAGGNLLLARVLPHEAYALVALVVAIEQLGVPLGPLGLEVATARYGLSGSTWLLRRTLLNGLLMAVVVSAIGVLGYELPPLVVGLVALATVAGSANTVAGAVYQGRQEFGRSVALVQSHNHVLLLAGLVSVARADGSALPPIAIITAGYVLSALVGWTLLLRGRDAAAVAEGRRAPTIAAEAGRAGGAELGWRSTLTLAGVRMSDVTLYQAERLTIPQVLPLASLATFGVLGALVGSPLRMLEMAVSHTVMPRLRAAATVRERRHIVRRELAVALVVVSLAAVAAWIITPPAVHYLLADRYVLPPVLVAAAIAAGVAKVLSAFAVSSLMGTGDAADLARFNALGWVSVLATAGLAALGGVTGGLAGLVFGVAGGWLLRAASAALMARRWFHLPASE